MDYQSLIRLTASHAGLKLLRAETLPLAASFLWETFVTSERSEWDQAAIMTRLEDFLPRVQETRAPRECLQQWVDAGYLKQSLGEQGGSPRYQLAAEIEKALHWLHGVFLADQGSRAPAAPRFRRRRAELSKS